VAKASEQELGWDGRTRCIISRLLAGPQFRFLSEGHTPG
jgi:hypothetical protein